MKYLQYVNLIALVCACGWTNAVWAQGEAREDPAREKDYVYETDSPVVAVGDVHGAYEAFFALLEGIGLVDPYGQWVGGKTHLVSLGDLVDRGPKSKAAMDLLMRLQKQAEEVGGKVHVLLGNHELMNMGGDLRDVSQAEYAAMGGPQGHQKAFAKEGIYGRWLRERPIAIKINQTLFTHGGLSSIAQRELKDLNAEFWRATDRAIEAGRHLQATGLLPSDRSLLDPLNAEEVPEAFTEWQAAAQSDFFGSNSLVWYRGNVSCHPLIEEQRLEDVLTAHNADRVVVGHTPTRSREIESRFDGKVLAIDTGMLAKIYRGKPRALRILHGETLVLLPDGTTRSVVKAGSVQKLVEELPNLSEKAAKREVAAYRLANYLGLDFVRKAEVIDGGLRIRGEALITERERQERQLYRPNNCEQESDYDLLSAFDSLIGKRDRTLDNLAYVRATWHIVVTDNGNAFETSSKLPTYARSPKLNSALRTRLEGLDEDVLNELLGSLLRSREIKAILKRRDKILAWPTASNAPVSS